MDMDDYRLKRKQQKATRRAHAGYHQHERVQQHEQQESQRTKKQKICIEKDTQAIDAHFDLSRERYANWPQPINKTVANDALVEFRESINCDLLRELFCAVCSSLNPCEYLTIISMQEIHLSLLEAIKYVVEKPFLEIDFVYKHLYIDGSNYKVLLDRSGFVDSNINSKDENLLNIRVCNYCKRSLDKGNTPMFSLANMWNGTTPQCLQELTILEQLLPENFPSATERARLAHLDPTAVAKYFNVMIEKIIKFIFDYKRPKGDVLGKIKNYYAVTEYQDCGTPHYHMLVWIQSALNPIELCDQLKFDISYLLSSDEDFLTDEMLNAEYKTPKTKLEKKIHPSILPIPDPRSPNFNKNFCLDVLRIAKHMLFHRCTKSCKKYYHDQTSNCHFDFPCELVEAPGKFYPELGIITLQRCNVWINNHNPYIIASCHGNNDIRFIAIVKLALAYIHYITNYITKFDASIHSSFLICTVTLNKFITEKSDSDEMLNEFVSRLRKLVTICLNRIVGQTEMTGPQVSAYLLGFEDHYTPNKFIFIYLYSFEMYLTSQYPIENLPESTLPENLATSSNESDQENNSEQNIIDDEIFAIVNSGKQINAVNL
ncbi:hypothetical protein Glove_33g191 [Diversispora epigaea]|uniref:Helitron helicase-like domain-containing protein n=1 Tax=Diversispora epigaea TaxID=1348612 RepID=A0A397JGV9_9GLOM|nr:hypothetical protein Glove_33g191 [Diversispora epigaea]